MRAGDVADEDPGAAELLVAAHQRQQDRHRAPLRPGAQGHVAQGRQGNGRQVRDPVKSSPKLSNMSAKLESTVRYKSNLIGAFQWEHLHYQ